MRLLGAFLIFTLVIVNSYGEDQICTKFQINYLQCEQLSDNNVTCADMLTRNYSAILSFEAGQNFSTNFNITQQNLWAHNPTYNYTIDIKFSVGKPNFNIFKACEETVENTCTASVPFLSTILIDINDDVDGTQTFQQFPLTFYNGQALYVNNEGDYVYWNMTNTAGLDNCLQPTVVQTPENEMYNQVTYCCLASSPITAPPIVDFNETCKSFDATINLLDKTQAHIASVGFTMDTTFVFYSENSDFRTIGIKTYDPPHNVQNQAYLTVNNEQECPLTNITQECYPNQANKYYTIFDLNYFNKTGNLSLYSTSSIVLNKFQHYYYTANGTKFSRNNNCFVGSVSAYDYFGSGLANAGTAESNICCTDWEPIVALGPTTTAQETTTPTTVITTTTQPINFNPPTTPICNKLSVHYVQCTDFTAANNSCNHWRRYWSAILNYEPGDNFTTKFTVSVKEYLLPNLFNVTIKFSIGKSTYASNFNKYVDCALNNGNCTVQVPYLSTMWLYVTDANGNGTEGHYQQGLSFYNGNALSVDSAGTYLSPNLSNSNSVGGKNCLEPLTIPGDVYTEISYCCVSSIVVPTLQYTYETCKSFNANITIFNSSSDTLAFVNFTVSTNFDLANPEIDYRDISIVSYGTPIDPNANILLEINAVEECPLKPITQSCENNQAASYFLQLDLNFFSQNKSISYYSSTAISLYKWWHAYYQTDGTIFSSNNTCSQRKVDALDYFGSQNSNAWAESNICCTDFVHLPQPPTSTATQTTTAPAATSTISAAATSTSTTVTTPSSTSITTPSTPAPSNEICTRFAINYIQCENLNVQNHTCLDFITRNYSAILDFGLGGNSTTFFTVSQQTLSYHQDQYNFTTSIQFSVGKPSFSNNFGIYYDCIGDDTMCTAQVPFLSSMILSVEDVSGTQTFQQYPLSFFNGYALYLDNQEDFVYWGMNNTAGLYNCLQPTVTQTPGDELYNRVTYCCIGSSPVPTLPSVSEETCKTFDASIRLFDKDEVYLASVNFTVDTVFDVYSLDNDFHTISIKSFDPPEDFENHAYLEVNVEQECPLTSITQQCYPNQTSKYYTIIDLNYGNKTDNLALYSTSSIVLFKLQHFYHKPDWTPFTSNDNCLTRKVNAYDYYGSKGSAGIAEASICCIEFIPIPQLTTPGTSSTPALTPVATTTQPYINPNPPNIATPKEFNIIYLQSDGWNYTANLPESIPYRYYNAKLSVASGPNFTTVFTVTQMTPPKPANNTFNFTASIKFSVGIPSYVNKFDDYYECNLISNMCQVSVPYLSTIYLFIDDASGAQQYHQLQLGFYNGNALYLDKEGDYLTESVYTDTWLAQKCLPKTQQQGQNNIFTTIFYCSDEANFKPVPMPSDFAFETCKTFDADITIYDNTNASLATVNFKIENDFDLATPYWDYRNIYINSYNVSVSQSNAMLYINMDDDCMLTSLTQQCDSNQNTTNFLNIDFSFDSPSKNMSLYTSTSISLYKWWHVYYKTDGSRFDPSSNCYKGMVNTLDYYGSQNGQANKGAYAMSNICCTSFINLTGIPYTPSTSYPGTGSTMAHASTTNPVSGPVSTVTTPSSTPITTPSTPAPSNEICTRFAINYIQCENLNVQNHTCLDFITRNYSAILDFGLGGNSTTSFTVSQQTLSYHQDQYNFTTSIQFSVGKPSFSNNFGIYYDCIGDDTMCTAQVPFLSSMILSVEDASGTQTFQQYPLSFFNGYALYLDNQGDFVYWGMNNTAGLYNCLQPTVTQTAGDELYNRVTYCCIDSSPIPTLPPVSEETCKTFDASIRLFDKDEVYLASVNFTVDTVFDVYSLDNDFHTISIKSFDPPEDSENHAYLEVNAEQECPLTSITQQCYPNQTSKYYTIIDLNYGNKTDNLALYSTSSIVLFKLQHFYHKPDWTPFTSNDNCLTRKVNAYDYYGSKGSAGIAEASICCIEFIPIPQLTTPGTSSTPALTPVATTTQPYINPNPPNIATPKEFNIIYLQSDGWNYTANLPESIPYRYYNAKLSVASGPNFTTVFTVTQMTPPTPANNTFNFNASVKFSVGIPSYVNKFDDYYECNLISNMCQVSVPYLSTIYLFIDDASGAQQYHQLQLGFYNGNALYLDKEGDYLTESVYTDTWLAQKCLPKTQQQGQNNIFTTIFYCSDEANFKPVPMPSDFAFETCQTFDADITIYDNTNASLATVNFKIENDFDLATPYWDYRNIYINSYNVSVSQSNAMLYINMDDDCRLTSLTQQCDSNQNTTNFLNIDFSFDSPSKSMSLYTSTAISLYKWWHVYYKTDGSKFDPSSNCYKGMVNALDYYGSQNGQANKGAYAMSNICCTSFVNLTGIPYTLPKSSPGTGPTAAPTSTIPVTASTATQGTNTSPASGPVSTVTTPSSQTSAPSVPNGICKQLIVNYLQCDGFDQVNKNCVGTTVRDYYAILKFEKGDNYTTSFTVTQRSTYTAYDNATFNITIKFGVGKSYYANNLNIYYDCPFVNNVCQVQVPYISTMYLFVNDANGAQRFVQYPLSFYNGDALYLDDAGDYLYSNPIGGTGNCMQPTAIEGSNNLYNQVSYCCNEADPIPTQSTPTYGFCKTFNAKIKLYDKQNAMIPLASINFNVSTLFDMTTENTDLRSININAFAIPTYAQNHTFLEINAGDDCNLRSDNLQCNSNDQSKYYLFLDFNLYSQANNTSLYSTTSVVLYKWNHVYYQQNGLVFSPTSNCYYGSVNTYDYFGSGISGTSESTVCCVEFETLPPPTTTGTGSPVTQQVTSSAATATVTQYIDPNPPTTPICTQLMVTYIECYDFNYTSNMCEDVLLRYYAATIDYEPGADITTKFTVKLLNSKAINETYNFNASIKFSVGKPSYVDNFNDFYDCEMINNICQVSVPYLSTMYLFISDVNGTNRYHQYDLSFYHGNALDIGSTGDYMNPYNNYSWPPFLLNNCMKPTQIEGPNNLYAQIIYCCSGDAVVPPPRSYAFESCQAFDANIGIYNNATNELLANVNFTVSSAFDLSNSDTDFRNIIVTSYNMPVDNSSTSHAFLEVNMNSECPLTPNTHQCDVNKPSSYFLNLDLNFNSPSKKMSMYSSTALSLYKYWHVYYTPDGAMFAPSNSCYTREVGVLNFFGNQSIQAIARSNICCSSFVTLNIPHSTTSGFISTTNTPPAGTSSTATTQVSSPPTPVVTQSSTASQTLSIQTSTTPSGIISTTNTSPPGPTSTVISTTPNGIRSTTNTLPPGPTSTVAPTTHISLTSSETVPVVTQTPPVQTSTTPSPVKGDEICTQFSLSYIQCYNFNKTSNACQGPVARTFDAMLSFDMGTNLTTNFNVTTIGSYYNPDNSTPFTPDFKFFVGKPGFAEYFEYYFNCLRNSNFDKSCSATVPYLSTMFFYVEDNDNTNIQQFVQYPLSFFNGKALYMGDEGDFLYPENLETTISNSKYCMQPVAKEGNNNLYSQVTYCCTNTEPAPTPLNSTYETCSSFTANITLYDPHGASLATVDFNVTTEFLSNTNNTDMREVSITTFNMPAGTRNGYLETNANTECTLNNFTNQCSQNQKTDDWLIFDFNFYQPNATKALYSTTSIVIYKSQHVYYKPDRNLFTKESSCYSRNVDVLDYFGEQNEFANIGATATGNICCQSWISLHPSSTTVSNTPTQEINTTTTTSTSTTPTSTTNATNPPTEPAKGSSITIRSSLIFILISLLSSLSIYVKL